LGARPKNIRPLECITLAGFRDGVFYPAAFDADLSACLAVARKLGDDAQIAGALVSMGRVYMSKGDFKQALACEEENLAVRKKIGDMDGEGQQIIFWRK